VATRRAIGTLLCGALALLVGHAWSGRSLAQQQPRDPEVAPSRVTPIVELVRKVGPTVVNLYADLEIESVSFWGVGTQQAGSLGSGVIIHPSGLVVTNAHVITGNARKSRIKDVTVSYRPDWTGSKAEMKKFKARVLGFDRNNDLALLAIQAPGPFPAAKLGKSADLMIGETVVAVGNPLGREGSVTHGIVSATNRSLESPTGDQFDDLIQTDAPLNSGNSGGPLFNILGELVGINEAIAGDRQFGRAEGQGLALPVDRVRDLLSNRFNAFDLLHLWLGLEDAEGDGHGVLVQRVERDGPAARAGLASGDVVVRVGSYDVVDRTSFNLSICSIDGDKLPLTIVRDGKRREVTVEPVSIDEFVHEKLGAPLTVEQGYLLFGEVDRRGSAAKLGIQQNDALVELDGKAVNSVQDVFEFLRKARHGDRASVLIYRSARGRPVRKLEGELEL
jgi:serine protease Do